MCLYNAPDALMAPPEFRENRIPLDWKCFSFQPRGAFREAEYERGEG